MLQICISLILYDRTDTNELRERDDRGFKGRGMVSILGEVV